MTDRPLIVVDLFSGYGGTGLVNGGWSCAARRRGHTVVTVEYEDVFKPSICGDIREITVQDIIDACGGQVPDIVYASPPCEGFSVMRLGKNWGKWPPEVKKRIQRNIEMRARTDPGDGPTPKSDQARLGRELMVKTLELVEGLQELNPNLRWWLENPVGIMRYQPELSHIHRTTITHASYHEPYASAHGLLGDAHHGADENGLPPCKPTDLWGSWPRGWKPRENIALKGAGEFYIPAPRGSYSGTQGMKGTTHPVSGEKITAYFVKSLIPFYLGWDTVVAVEDELGIAAPIDYRAHAGSAEPEPPAPSGLDQWFSEGDA